MIGASDQSRGRSDQYDRSAVERKHGACGFARNQKSAETVLSPAVFKARDLNVERATRSEVLDRVDHEIWNAHLCQNISDQPLDRRFARCVAPVGSDRSG